MPRKAAPKEVRTETVESSDKAPDTSETARPKTRTGRGTRSLKPALTESVVVAAAAAPVEPHKARTSKGTAGRPALDAEQTSVVFTLRLRPETAKACRDLGGSVLVRNMIEKVVAEEECQRRARSTSNFVGFEPVASKRRRAPMPGGLPGTVKRAGKANEDDINSPVFHYDPEDFELDDYFIDHPRDTFAVTASGDSMVDAGIFEGDLLILDRAVEPRSGDIVLAVIDGSLTVKRLKIVDGGVELHPENKLADYPVLRPERIEDFRIEGVVTGLGRRIQHHR